VYLKPRLIVIYNLPKSLSIEVLRKNTSYSVIIKPCSGHKLMREETIIEIKSMAMKIFNAYEDIYLDKDKRKIFDDLFDRYLTLVDMDRFMDTYDAIVSLGLTHRFEYDLMVKTLKDQSLISD
jgi:hypothetical protein